MSTDAEAKDKIAMEAMRELLRRSTDMLFDGRIEEIKANIRFTGEDHRDYSMRVVLVRPTSEETE